MDLHHLTGRGPASLIRVSLGVGPFPFLGRQPPHPAPIVPYSPGRIRSDATAPSES